MSPFTLSAFAEVFYCYDLNKPVAPERQNFMYSYNRHNEPALNLGVIYLAGEGERWRTGLGLMTGTYAVDNLKKERGIAKYIFESVAGVKLFKDKNIWLDAGVFSSHIGFEYAVSSADNWTLTRSLMADNSPYYESGAKLTFIHQKWLFSLLALNGWQSIRRQPLAFGHQLTYKPDDQTLLNSSSFIGQMEMGASRPLRIFHNAYAQCQLNSKWEMLLGLDAGAQEKLFQKDYAKWITVVLQSKYAIHKQVSLAARMEYFHDPDEVVISTTASNGFTVVGYSLNADYRMRSWITWRIEGRAFAGSNNYFIKDGNATDQNLFFTISCLLGGINN
ncbi:MAG: porin [Bacteroidia bacterium]